MSLAPAPRIPAANPMRRLPSQARSGRALLTFAGEGAGRFMRTALAAGMAAGLVMVAAAVWAAPLLDTTRRSGVVVPVSAGVLLGASVVASFVLRGMRDRVWRSEEDRVHAVAEPAVWDRLLGAELSFFRNQAAQRAVGQANAVTQLRRLVAPAIDEADAAMTLCLTGLALFTIVDVRLGLAMLGVAAAVTIGVGRLGVQHRSADEVIADSAEDLAPLLYPVLAGIDEVHVFGREQAMLDRWTAAFDRFKASEATCLSAEGRLEAVLAAVPPVLGGTVLLVGWQVEIGRSGLVLAGLATVALGLGLVTLQRACRTIFMVGRPAWNRLCTVMAAVPESTPDHRVPDVLSGGIELEGVTLTYPGAPVPSLRDVTAQVRPGEFLAVTGPSGAGKSSLMRLLVGLERPQVGTVRYDGADLNTLDLAGVRAQIGYAAQDGRPPRGNLRSGILGASGRTGDEQAWAAARSAGIDHDIALLPLGMDTPLSDSDGGFSGSQVQRLMLARALARSPRLLLMDEATSALDRAGEQQVMRWLGALPITRVVVTHRAETLRAADRIIVLEGGRIVESGSYDDLMMSGGGLARLLGRRETENDEALVGTRPATADESS